MSNIEVVAIKAPEGEENPFQWEDPTTTEELPAQTLEVLFPVEAK